MFKKLFIIYLIALNFQTHTYAVTMNIIENHDFTNLETIVDNSDENTLVIFDVKTVLITAKDLILSPIYKTQFKKLKEEMNAHLSQERIEILYGILLAQQKSELVEGKILEILTKIKSKNIKSIALTSGKTGKFGYIKKREDLRINVLKELGIDFSFSYPTIETITFNNITNINVSRPPMYKKGILFTSNAEKGIVLKEFYNKEKIFPKKIVFVDNQLKNLHSVGKFCQAANIEYIGIHYTNVVNRKILPLNEKVAKYQFEILAKENKWLSDAEAMRALSIK